MIKLNYSIEIKSPAMQVYDKMLGISKKKNYERWTAIFNPTSTYEGNWKRGSKMLFIGTDSKGEKGGMISEVAENIENRFVSLRHYGLVQSDVEVTEGPEVEKWTGGFENYRFDERNDFTQLSIELDTTEDFVDYMNEHYPKALTELKKMCEGK